MKIELPHVGESVTEGMIGQWLKKVGDSVEKYEPLVEVVTDKVNMEMPSPVSGILTEILVNEGETIPMGTIIAEIDIVGEAEAAPAESAPPVPSVSHGSSAEEVDRHKRRTCLRQGHRHHLGQFPVRQRGRRFPHRRSGRRHPCFRSAGSVSRRRWSR